MPSTFLDLTNQVLTQLNEVELTASTFASARGIHAAAKNGIKYAVKKINTQKFEWPFNASNATHTLIVGEPEIAFPNNFKKVDWDSFFVHPPIDGSADNTRIAQLQHIKKETYYHLYAANDMSGNNAPGVPKMVYETHNGSWGLSPFQDHPYEITFRYWVKPDELTAYDDEVTIPSEYDYVIVLGALSHMKMFKDDLEAFSASDKLFQDGIRDMIGVFISTDDHMTDTRVNF